MEDTTIEDTLKTVADLYAKKDFTGALEILKGHKSDVSEGLWHYNMGTVYAGMKNFPLARFHLIEAENQGLTSDKVTQNLQLVEEKLEIPRLEKPLDASDYLIKGSLLASQGILTTLALLTLVVGVLSLRKGRSLKKLGLFSGMILVLLGCNWWVKTWPKYIVTSPQLIHEGPSTIFSAQTELPVGVMLVASPENEWVKIVYPARFQGWVKHTGLKELK